MKYRILNTLPNYIIVEGEPDFRYGLLFLHNIVFRGKEMSLPFASSIIERIRKDQSLLDKISIKSWFNEHKDAILTLECEEFYKGLDLTGCLEYGKTYDGTVLAQSMNYIIIGVNGHYGFIEGVTTYQIDEHIQVTPTDDMTNIFGFYRFWESSTNNNATLTSNQNFISQPIEEFLSKDELIAISEEEKDEIEQFLKEVPVTRKSIDVLREDLYITNDCYNLKRFLIDQPNYFTGGNFWVGCYKESDKDETFIIIYDHQGVVLKTRIERFGIRVIEFFYNKNNPNAQFLLDKNQNALIIRGNQIHIYDYNNIQAEEYYKQIGTRIYTQHKIAKKILPRLKCEVKNIKEKAGKEYMLLKEYLSFQEKNERKLNKEQAVTIHANELCIATTNRDGHSTGLRIKSKANELRALFTDSNIDNCYIELHCGENKVNAKLSEEEDGVFLIEFYNTHVPINDWKNSGFEIRRQAGIRDLQLQQHSIKEFVFGSEKFDIFDKLNRGELRSPKENESIIFYDEKFNQVEENNNQPQTIRKAVNNEDIFLIQGPPGTGKTSVIVEIVKQLVKKQEKVLVCSQAHSAVNNIYSRLINTDFPINIGNIDEEETMKSRRIQEHPSFLKNNIILLNRLIENERKEELLNNYDYEYSDSTKKEFMKYHEHICDYYQIDKPENLSELSEIIIELKRDLENLGDAAVDFNRAHHYQSLNVVMGTCIGIGMDWGLSHSGIYFDTVIVDEAGKANLSETIVPMRLGKKFILVGDHKQLPPYMDKEEIDDFLENSFSEEKVEDVVNAISTSLFEDFLKDEKFPQESMEFLNVQYRMNPEIGDYISDLFYDKVLKNGAGTNNQKCILEGFPNAVTFIDTSINEDESGQNIAYEKGDSKSGIYNEYEIQIIKNDLLPKLEKLMNLDSRITIGIITPYRKQRQLLLDELKNTFLEGKVYTIDSIQGSEFDVVVLSLVRSFNPNKSKRKVGFLDDLRRLNVALSRAKKKLIIIGNSQTLCNEKAHSNVGNNKIKPVEVFRKMTEKRVRKAKKTSLDILKYKVENGEIAIGEFFICKWDLDYKGRPFIKLEIDNSFHEFNINPNDKDFERFAKCKPDEKIKIKFLGFGEKDGRAKFKYIPDVPIADQIHSGLKSKVRAKPYRWTDNDKMVFKFYDGSEMSLYPDKSSDFLNILFDKIEEIPIFIRNETVFLDDQPYKIFKNNHQEAELVKIDVIDECDDFYLVKCEEVFGKVVKGKGIRRRQTLTIGESVNATIYKMYNNCVNFIVYI